MFRYRWHIPVLPDLCNLVFIYRTPWNVIEISYWLHLYPHGELEEFEDSEQLGGPPFIAFVCDIAVKVWKILHTSCSHKTLLQIIVYDCEYFNMLFSRAIIVFTYAHIFCAKIFQFCPCINKMFVLTRSLFYISSTNQERNNSWLVEIIYIYLVCNLCFFNY